MVVLVTRERRLPYSRAVEDDVALDRSFFDKLVQPSTTDTDWDIYLVESIWPILSRGLAALALEELKAMRIEEKEVAVVGTIRADEDRDELEFTQLCAKLSENEEIRKILDEDFILTGMEPAEGEEVVDEVPPRGSHVELLCDLMEKAGFRKDPNRFSGDEIAPELAALGDQQTFACEGAKWTVGCMHQWSLLQRLLVCECEDGVVDAESLKLMMDRREFSVLKRKVSLTKDVHLRSTTDDDTLQESETMAQENTEIGSRDPAPAGAGGPRGRTSSGERKPSLKELSDRYNINIIRLAWLSEQFGTLLPDGHDDYPDNPQSLSKSAVRGLAEELCPEITDEEFEAKWEIIDADRSGSLEFDEFVEWMALDEFDIDDGEYQPTIGFL
ncbi:hypothetical protein FOZ61_003444 [Perkinsus olseni]|uniref:EF-hand domain-containing protein n=1 Tax=Perkinsus olseni TaxID=32597 RepID=A0A7J6LPK9_PEROL|nr:hypothetical protein FOZ61_003444 [Perkinsus olseni]